MKKTVLVAIATIIAFTAAAQEKMPLSFVKLLTATNIINRCYV